MANAHGVQDARLYPIRRELGCSSPSPELSNRLQRSSGAWHPISIDYSIATTRSW
jgi:hypothetical protein